MPLLTGSPSPTEPFGHWDRCHIPHNDHHDQQQSPFQFQLRKNSQTQHSTLAKSALVRRTSLAIQAHAGSPEVSPDSSPSLAPATIPVMDNLDGTSVPEEVGPLDQMKVVGKSSFAIPDRPSALRHRTTDERVNFAQDVKNDEVKPKWAPGANGNMQMLGNPRAWNDTPAATAPNSPNMQPRRSSSSGDKPRAKHPTTLDIPGLTKSAVSPDGRIAQRDLGAKLVIVMVGLPARGKSYITKKLARYLNWLQHDTRIFNVGARRRVATWSGSRPTSMHGKSPSGGNLAEMFRQQFLEGASTDGDGPKASTDAPTAAARILLNGGSAISSSPEEAGKHGRLLEVPELKLPDASQTDGEEKAEEETEQMDQSAAFFDPSNKKAAQLREQVAMETLDELLDYVMNGSGAVGILDATNSTISRRKAVMAKIREVAGPDLNVLFLESVCVDENLLERNMRLKLSGPDYRDKDPEASLADFKQRVALYQKSYVSLGDYEERNNISYVQMIDVGRKVISHQIQGFLSGQAVYYLLNFNLAPRQIWITRHGESEDNLSGRLGGDSELTSAGHAYARALASFLDNERKEWEVRELDRQRSSHLPPHPGDSTPPNPHYAPEGDEDHITHKNFCVWSSMLKRSIQTAEYFDEADYDLKQMRMLNEIYAGKYEGYTYEQIKDTDRDTFDERKKDKLHYRYPGPGGEGYLDVINRLRPVIVELERMTDHCLLIGHRSIARILLAYFKGLGRDEVTDLDVPLGMLYCLEPKPYGVDFKAYQYSSETQSFDHVPEYTLQRANSYVE